MKKTPPEGIPLYLFRSQVRPLQIKALSYFSPVAIVCSVSINSMLNPIVNLARMSEHRNFVSQCTSKVTRIIMRIQLMTMAAPADTRNSENDPATRPSENEPGIVNVFAPLAGTRHLAKESSTLNAVVRADKKAAEIKSGTVKNRVKNSEPRSIIRKTVILSKEDRALILSMKNGEPMSTELEATLARSCSMKGLHFGLHKEFQPVRSWSSKKKPVSSFTNIKAAKTESEIKFDKSKMCS